MKTERKTRKRGTARISYLFSRIAQLEIRRLSANASGPQWQFCERSFRRVRLNFVYLVTNQIKAAPHVSRLKSKSPIERLLAIPRQMINALRRVHSRLRSSISSITLLKPSYSLSRLRQPLRIGLKQMEFLSSADGSASIRTKVCYSLHRAIDNIVPRIASECPRILEHPQSERQ